MRTLAFTLPIATAVGCAPGNAAFQYESTLYDSTRGLVLQDADTAQAGMVGNTCEVRVDSAGVGRDVDVAESDDHVEDAFAGVVLVRGTSGLHLYQPAGYTGGGSPILPGDDVLGGALIDGGVVAVSGDNGNLRVSWTGDQVTSQPIAGTQFDGLTVDRTSGTAFVVSDGAIEAVGPDGTHSVDGGDFAAWDAAAEVLYVADRGGHELRGVEADGGRRFATPMDGDISAIGSLNGQAVVSIAGAGAGQLVFVDGFTGEVTDSEPTPGAADALRSSPHGDTLAVVVDGQTHFFRDHRD